MKSCKKRKYARLAYFPLNYVKVYRGNVQNRENMHGLHIFPQNMLKYARLAYFSFNLCQKIYFALSRMSFQPSKKDVNWLVRKVVLVLCYVILLVIGPILK